MVTRKGLVAKIEHFPPQNGDEKGSRRQKVKFSSKKRRRERVSSSKTSNFRLKVVTRKGLVVKKVSFQPQSGDEKESRRQNKVFLASNWSSRSLIFIHQLPVLPIFQRCHFRFPLEQPVEIRGVFNADLISYFLYAFIGITKQAFCYVNSKIN